MNQITPTSYLSPGPASVMRASLSVRLLLLLAAGITQVQSLQIDVPSEWERRCEIPVTITRESDDDPETFALAYIIEDDPLFTSFFATPTDTGLTPQTVLFAIASPGVFGIEAMDIPVRQFDLSIRPCRIARYHVSKVLASRSHLSTHAV
ncbi:hypothetical protein DFH05DRAFT_180867 [Lentinula detonsa]|uniref:Uncharacterized protein n=1 Tax=Lentinula detonsa TaxID=2804962 RepID=A0A9W8PCJ0_9AGAR|nr:hypothetical protein DFH05DRAFT_180867 [Lentinula detonsa]